jgi:F-type H+-transporting ATPase subunit a
VAISISSIAFYATRNPKKIPTGLQGFLEIVVEALDKFFREMLGSATSAFLPFLGSLFIYILLMNLMGLIPLLHSSTSNLNTTLGLAIVVFIATHYAGFSRNGFVGYLKHFMGEPLWLAPLMFPLHIVGELSRPVSLAMRLFGNIMGEDTAIAIFVGLAVSFYLPIQFPMLLLALLTSFIQAGIFSMLACVYIAGVVQEHH